MSNNKMLIDATHPEETRVVVLRGGRVEEFDFESAARKLLRGNIYLAKVTRVEPSLQAAFVDYGGNRHGFLAFGEIHPDYYQIPIADRQALIDEEAAAEAEEEAEVDRVLDARAEAAESGAVDVTDLMPPENDRADEADEVGRPDAASLQPRAMAEGAGRDDDDRRAAPLPSDGGDDRDEHHAAERDAVAGEAPITVIEDGAVETVEVVGSGQGAEPEQVESVGSEDALEELPSRPRRRMRSYKIQEVIKRRQVILVQVVKEERGTKGAALTTYLSLAGRYTVLMPNTARGGGISRKITNPQDRKRLKAIANELEVPEGMGLIIRTAGAARTKQEIRRDFEYLLRLWESVRDLTLQSTAPSLVYEEGNLIKRSIRDLYTKEIEEIVVAGEAAHHEARDFMRMLMPSHAKNVIHYAEPEPLFTRHHIERQLNAMFSPYVHLRSGGYLVINQTEALVAIDVNSGKSTREYSIEETALNTNLEASDEIARQLKLRDLAGLIVIDFIDMEEKRNNRSVERRLKEALRFDRARIQVGRISHFGLMEMSRQRLRTGVLEGSTSQCPHCQGTGIIRSTESVSLAVIRALEDALIGGAKTSLVATTAANVALYLLNHKRQFIHDMEARYGITIKIQTSDKTQGANFTVEAASLPAQPQRRPEQRGAVNMGWGFDGEEDEAAVEEVEETVAEPARGEGSGRGESSGEREDGQRGGRRRRRRGRDRDRPEPRDRPRVAAADDDRDGEPGERKARWSGGGGGDDDRGDEPRAVSESRDDEDDDRPTEVGGGRELRAEREEGGEAGRARRGRRRGRRGGRRGREGGGDGLARESAGQGEPGEMDGREADGLEAGSPRMDGPAMGGPEMDDQERPAREPRREPRERGAERREPRERASRREPREREPRRERRPVEPDDLSPPVAAPNGAHERPATEPEPAPAMAAPPEIATPAPARRSTVTSEPVIERVVVRPDAGAVAAEADEAAKPARKGWWQRRILGE